jgi:MtrB/PioB family decaheme-associated outer membrane protein
MPMTAVAADPSEAEIAVIRRPTNYIEAGIENVGKKSGKFGEYNGLTKDRAEFIGNFSLRGGDAYEGGDGTMRWGVTGTDLGTTSRELGANVGSQGQWSLSIGYDELKRTMSDSYQTPQQGSMGGNTFVLPTNFGAINAANGQPSGRSMNATQLGAFHTEEVSTTRKNTSFAAGFIFSPQLSLKFDYNHLDQSGAKLMGVSSQGGIAIGAGPASTGRAEAVAIIMNPTNYKTDNFNLALNWVGDKGHLTAGYYGSIFRDGYNSVSSQNNFLSGAIGACAGAACFVTNVMSTMPSNNFHQLNLTGGWAISPATKLTGGFSYGRNTQNDSYAPGAVMQAGVGVLPQSSLNGLVVTRHADVKLTNKTTKDLTISAAYKFNERDNRTSSNRYLYTHLAGGAGAAFTGVNTPYSNKKSQFEVAGDYRVAKDQTLRLAYERENIKRWCDNVADGFQCISSPASREDKLDLAYRMKPIETVQLNAGYAISNRKADLDPNYVSNGGNRLLAVLVPGGFRSALNGENFAGFVGYIYASRKQDTLKASANWQATDKIDFGLSGRQSDDKYDAALGVQNGKATTLNLDATYSYGENSSVSAYASWQNSKRDMRNGFLATDNSAAAAPARVWTNQLETDSNAIGLNTKHAGLMGGKLELLGDLSYTFDKSRYSTQDPGDATCGTAAVLTCGNTPDIKNRLLTFKLTGTYSLDKSSKVAVVYLYQSLKSEDYFYNGYQYGATPNRVMPTNEQAPNYSVNVLGVSYTYSFK